MKSSLPVRPKPNGEFHLLEFRTAAAGARRRSPSPVDADMFATYQQLPEPFQERIRRLVDFFALMVRRAPSRRAPDNREGA